MTRLTSTASGRALRPAGRGPRRSWPLAIVLGLAAPAAGCASPGGDPAAVPPPDAPAALALARGVAYAQKDRFVVQAKAGLADLEDALKRLDAEVALSAGAPKIEGQARLEALRERLARTREQLDRVEIATAANWEAARDAFEGSREELGSSFGRARDWMKKELDP